MAARSADWTWPVVCAGVTLAAFTLGLVWNGAADWVAAGLLLVPVAVLVWKTRWAKRR